MKSATVTTESRAERIDYVSRQLLPGVALLTRLLVRHLGGTWSRTEVSLLNTLSYGPRRITELAEFERLAQPTMTQLVKRLEQSGLVTRERQPDDGRVVLVALTEAGVAAVEDFRAQASAALGTCLVEMPDEQVEALAAATETLAQLVTLLQERTST
jgi:DNA-binding MarR family transcriptional regulator